MTSNGKGSGATDPTWNHCVSIDGKARNVKCKYCEKVLIGGIYRLKHYLPGTSKDIGAYIVVLEDVKKNVGYDLCVTAKFDLKNNG